MTRRPALQVRTWANTAPCIDCEGTGTVEAGVRGPNDPEVVHFECRTCGGSGEVEVPECDLADDIASAPPLWA